MSILVSPLPVVIPSAGLGARFLPLSRVVPKELLPLGRFPLIHHALLEAARAGLGPVTIVISPAKRGMLEYFERDAQLDHQLAVDDNPAELAERLQVRFVEAETRGPGEAVLRACDATGADTVAVLFPDDVIPGVEPWPAMLALLGATGSAVMSLRRFAAADSERFGVAVCEQRGGALHVRRLVEKPLPGTVDSPLRVFGRYILTAPVLQALALRRFRSDGELQLTDGYADSLDKVGVVAHEFTGETYDCGTPEEYSASLLRYGRRRAVYRSGAEQLVPA